MGRRISISKFFEDCKKEETLSDLLWDFTREACRVVEDCMGAAYGHRLVAKNERTTKRLGNLEAKLRTVCKDRRIAVPNLALSKLVQYALRPPRRSKMRAERKSC